MTKLQQIIQSNRLEAFFPPQKFQQIVDRLTRLDFRCDPPDSAQPPEALSGGPAPPPTPTLPPTPRPLLSVLSHKSANSTLLLIFVMTTNVYTCLNLVNTLSL